MDRITKSLVEELCTTEEITNIPEDDQYEHFCNYSIIANEYNKTFNLSSVHTGSGDDTGIDGIAIIVNGHLVEETAEIDNLLTHNGYLEILYLFIQAKNTTKFDTKEIRNFGAGVIDFFEEEPTLRRNVQIVKAANISNYLLDKATKFRDNPKCKLFYVTTGQYNEEDQNIQSIIKKTISDLKNTNLFSNIDFQMLGANDIGKIYRKSKNPITATFTFNNKVTLENIEGVKQAYYGLLPFSEFKKILIDENDTLNSIFDDNVRDFQGINNTVNNEIDTTLSKEPGLFSVLNNGITIVADSLMASGNSFSITDYQIVNGCQTSNVLYNHRNQPSIDSLPIPVKLIVTDNEDVKSKITVSTNNQTAIKQEQLTAMSDFQKNLERYYDTTEGDAKLYYERRSKQYSSDSSIIKRRIITVPVQIKSFASMFLKNPHQVTSYFGEITKNIGEKGSNIFEESHLFTPYYLAGLAYYRLDTLFMSGLIDTKYKKVKYYLLMLFLMVLSKEKLEHLNSTRFVEKYCSPIINVLNDAKKCKDTFLACVLLIENSGINIDDKQVIKSKSTTDLLIKAALASSTANPS